MKTTLTIEESAYLIELGVDEKMASHTESNYYNGISSEEFKVCHLFNLTDILSILPKEIFVDKISISIVFEWQCDKWYACYMGHGYMIGDCYAPELIDALNSLLIWAITNGHVKTEKK